MSREPAADMSAFHPDLNAGLSQCPICGRRWVVTPADDCLVPACGHYGDDPLTGDRPCEECGLAHALACPDTRRSPNEQERTG